MKIRYEVISDTGRERANNEDMALLFGAMIRDGAQRSMVPMRSRPRFTALVADGMGGYGGGEIASEMTLRSFDTFIGALPAGLTPREVTQAVREWFKANQEAVMARATTEPGLAQMGTTLTGIFSYGPDEYMLNAGDSRVYRWRYETLRQLTTDHSERERTGDMTVPSNLIYNAVGVPGAFVDVTVMSAEMPMIDGDVYVICSDGLSDMLTDEDISKVLSRGGGARELTDAALAAGGRDNCTVIVLYVSIPEESEEAASTAAAMEAEVEPEPADLPAETPAEVAFKIDDDDDTDAAADTAVTPVPPPYEAPMRQEGSADDYEEITEEEALKLAPGVPTAAERVKMASGRLREAWDILRGKKRQ